jgi:hypothetical protein
MGSVTCVKGSVSASFSRMMNRGWAEAPSISTTALNLPFRRISKVRSPVATTSPTLVMRSWPEAMRAPQRLIDATTSLAVTGLPSCHFRPGRSAKDHTMPSGLDFQVSTI